MSIATKTGDNGTTGRLYGTRVSKTSESIAAVGDIDETSAAIGLIKAQISLFVFKDYYPDRLAGIQRTLTFLMGEVIAESLKRKEYVEKFDSVADYHLTSLDKDIFLLEQDPCTKQKDWVMYGNSAIGAACDFASKVCRRAERSLLIVKECEDLEVNLSEDARLRPLLFQYMNRLSDFLHLLARYFDSIQTK